MFCVVYKTLKEIELINQGTVKNMSNITICRVCLADNLRMHAIANTQLHEIYEILAYTKLDPANGKPTMLCYICLVQLQRCHDFVRLARRSETLLANLFHSELELTRELLTARTMERPRVERYSITPVEYVNIREGTMQTEYTEEARNNIKMEHFDNIPQENNAESHRHNALQSQRENIKEDPDGDRSDCNAPIYLHSDSEDDLLSESLKNEVKIEGQKSGHSEKSQQENITEDPTGDAADCNATIDFQSDSEDDIPLKSLKTSNTEVELERQKRRYTKRRKLDVREVLLTKEQQLQDVKSRATSLNYRNSPYRCQLCYRGFISHTAFSNHKDKHDERSGPFECEFCKLRYQSARLLRTHTYTAHARYYQCNTCNHLSHTAHQASDHERWHAGHTYCCQLCGKSFTKRTSYLTHVRARHPGGHVCAACGDRFVGAHGLLMHQTKAHRKARQEAEETSPPSERFCSSCDVQFVTSRAWTRHILNSAAHLDQAELTKECPICGGRVEGEVGEHLKLHARELRARRPRPRPVADIEQPLACEHCEQTFVSKGRLAAHVRRAHLGLRYNKNVVCELCGIRCTSNAAMKYHQRTHTGERPYKCESCPKRFSDKNQARIHTRTHTGDKPYACQHCHKRFAQKPALNRHYRVHTGAKPYTCSLCSKAFSQSNSLKGHVNSVHLKIPSGRRKGRGAPAAAAPPLVKLPTSLDKTEQLALSQV